ncbi:MAG: heme ABC transporter ATP-binding protein [Nevskiaceae bacterium]|nr:MAG: heme ABC transporter ATP-binding protein [Nevskiaceae bacterium]TBR74810.1 MAG: heme ABC transporter ATP-binding protein [Nevskiaceae bacterium]
MTKLKTTDLCFSVPGRRLLAAANLQVAAGEVAGLVGPNGSGKSTLLKNLCRVLTPESGAVYIDGKDARAFSHRAMAREMAVVGQQTAVDYAFSVREIVLMGRAPHLRALDGETTEDFAMAQQALEKVGLQAYADRDVTTLSGGEKQLVLIARALAQDAGLLLLDEPTNHLDVHHQLQFLELVRSLGRTVVVALHDLNLAARYCDRIHVIEGGHIVAHGTPEAVLTPALLHRVFHVQAEVFQHPVTRRPHITYLASDEPTVSPVPAVHCA